MDDKYSLVDPRAAALWHAIASRRLHNYRAARETAKQHGDDLTGLIEPPSYEDIEAAYTRLAQPSIDEIVTNTNVARCILELMAAIAHDQEFSFIFDDAPVVLAEKDRSDMVRLIYSLSGWLKQRQINEAIITERERLR